MLIRRKDAQEFSIPGGTEGVLYSLTDRNDQSVAFVESNGVYPESGWSVNDTCTETFYVLEGQMTLEVGGETHELTAGDLYAVRPGNKYRSRGTCKIMVFITPVWDKAQNHIVES